MDSGRVARIGVLVALMYIMKVVFESIPNVEMVTTFIICMALVYQWDSLWVVNIFNFLEILQWGFGWWNVGYFLVWNLLVVMTVGLAKRLNTNGSRAVLSGVFGITFGALFALTYLPVGVSYAFVYWVNGIRFDIVHCIGNVVITYTLSDTFIKVMKKGESEDAKR